MVMISYFLYKLNRRSGLGKCYDIFMVQQSILRKYENLNLKVIITV